MTTRSTHILSGIAAGVIAGIIFGAFAAMAGMLVSIAGIVGSSSAIVGFAVNLVVSVIVAALFVVLFNDMIADYADGLTYGILYGFAWWILGALILMPLFLSAPTLPITSFEAILAAWPSLLMHLVFGVVLGVGYVLFRPKEAELREGRKLDREYYRRT